MNVVRYESRIKLLLEKFVDGKCQIQNEELLKRFFAHLWKQEKTEVESTIITLPIFTEWIKKAVGTWSTTAVSLDTNIVSFTLNLASLLSKKEQRFDELNSNNFFIKLVKLSKARHLEVAPSVKLSYINLLLSVLEHKSGIEWMIASNFWEDAYLVSLSGETDQVKKISTQFILKLLEKTAPYDDDFRDNVIKRIMQPLGENIDKSLKAPTDNDAQQLGPTLKLIAHILDHFLFDQQDFEFVLIFFKNFHLEKQISDLMKITQPKRVFFDLAKILFTLQFLRLHIKVTNSKLDATSIKSSVDKIKSNFILSISKGNYEDILDFCKFGQTYWSLVDKKIPQDKEENKLPFGDQLVSLQLMPNFLFLANFHLTKEQIGELLREEARDRFIQKVSNAVSHEFLRICFYWREYLLSHKDDLYELGTQGLQGIKSSWKYLSRERAICVFQSLIFSAKDFLHATKNSPEKLDNLDKDSDHFSQVFDVVALLIENFRITWNDAFEAMDVLGVCFDFLSLPNGTRHTTVKTLKLIDVAVALALLVDSSEDSIVKLMGPLLYAKLCHDQSEVKKAVLEVIKTVTRMSSKFPSLQKVLMDSELPTLVVKMSACDGESFVRATAIKCLQEMIQVEEIWNNALKTEDLSQKMRDILLNETEGIVRVEAATFMCVAYEHQQFPKDTLNKVYETMIYSSTTDLHWEVKVRALGFWDKVIKNHLQNQGMIDDSFPNVTFSKEHRKIVTLTDSEIRKRLLKVLSQLSSIGCLGVLMSAIKDDCDMEVSKTAVKITQRLVDLFKKYNVRSDCSAPTSPLPTENGMSATVSMSSGISVDESVDSPASNHPDFNEEIIDQIVNSKDVSLLKNVYAPSDYGSVSNYDIQVRKIVTPNEFLQFTQQDLNNLITEKKNWLNGIEDLGSLLDDMLKTYDDDVNNMDCY